MVQTKHFVSHFQGDARPSAVPLLILLLNACQVDLQPVEPPFPDVRGFARVPLI